MMMTRVATKISLIGSALALLATPARATVLFDSLGGATGGQYSTSLGNLDATFTTSSSPLITSDVAFDIGGTGDPGSTFTVSLMGGVPIADLSFDPDFGLNVSPFDGPVIAAHTFAISSLSANPTVEHFSEFSGVALKADSLYWIDVTAPAIGLGSGTVDWSTTSDVSGIGVADNYNSSVATDFDFFRNAGVPPFLQDVAFQMEVLGTAVPEVSTWGMMPVGFAGLGFAGWRASRTTAAAAPWRKKSPPGFGQARGKPASIEGQHATHPLCV